MGVPHSNGWFISWNIRLDDDLGITPKRMETGKKIPTKIVNSGKVLFSFGAYYVESSISNVHLQSRRCSWFLLPPFAEWRVPADSDPNDEGTGKMTLIHARAKNRSRWPWHQALKRCHVSRKTLANLEPKLPNWGWVKVGYPKIQNMMVFPKLRQP